ncbi:MAG: hypothetical protein MRY21_00455 [Simkaniaceae bacterium]|nr:hypothetical protein [Simkaniaceae bacterium]
MKRRSFTILEIFVGSLLACLLIGLLFNKLHSQIKGQKVIEETMSTALNHARFNERLSLMMMRLEGAMYTERNPESDLDELFFQFDNGIDPDPNFCHLVEAKLFRNRSNQVILELKSETPNVTPRKEILLANIEELSFGFTVTKNAPAKKAAETLATWQKGAKEAPDLLEISLLRNGITTPFLFRL